MKSLTSIETLGFKNLSFSYEGHVTVLEDCTFEFPANEVVLIEGQAGTGRSSLLKLLAGLVSPQTGGFYINGVNATDMSFEEFLPLRKRIGYSFDFGGLFANRTLWDNMTLPLMYHNEISHSEIEERVTLLSQKFGFYEARDRRPAAVSGGMRKAVIVARSFVMHPQMLLMDDPFVALDESTMNLVFDLIEAFRKQGQLKHVFLTARDEKMIRKIPFQRIFIENKKLYLNTSFSQKVVGL